MPNQLKAPKLLASGSKMRELKEKDWGKTIRPQILESIFFQQLGNSSAQLRLILFLTGNANDGSFAVPEKTVCERLGFKDAKQYRSARDGLIARGWITHGESITINYDKIYEDGGYDVKTSTKR